MKRYKLIREYPGSPKLNTIVEEHKTKKSLFVSKCNFAINHPYYFPEFWEEIDNNFILPVKQPLFTTEDGVDIFEGDEFYSTHKDGLGSILKYTGHSLENASKKQKDFVDFSTKEKAEEYILMNKPVLSLSDVWDHLSIKNRKVLTKFVKNKLN